jgi:hypothetical protein
MLFEPFIPDLFNILLGHDPGRTRGWRGIEEQEVWPGRFEIEADVPGIHHLNGFDPVFQEL